MTDNEQKQIIDAAIALANAGPTWPEQSVACRAFERVCPSDELHALLKEKALKVLADEVDRLRDL